MIFVSIILIRDYVVDVIVNIGTYEEVQTFSIYVWHIKLVTVDDSIIHGGYADNSVNQPDRRCTGP